MGGQSVEDLNKKQIQFYNFISTEINYSQLIRTTFLSNLIETIMIVRILNANSSILFN